jgi:hypothetical protein
MFHKITIAFLLLISIISAQAPPDTASNVTPNETASSKQIATPREKKFHWGLGLGINLTSYTGLTDGFFRLNPSLSLVLLFSVTQKMAFETGVTSKGISYGDHGVFAYSPTTDPNFSGRDFVAIYNYITFPLHLNYLLNKTRIFIFGGTQIGFILNGYGGVIEYYKDGSEINMVNSIFDMEANNRLQLALDGGIGYRFLLKKIQICPKLGYSQGIIKLYRGSSKRNYSQEILLSCTVLF